MKHEHNFTRTVANRPGLVTLRCGCGKLTLLEYGTAAEYVDLSAELKQRRAAVAHYYELLKLKIETLRASGFNQAAINQILAKEVPA